MIEIVSILVRYTAYFDLSFKVNEAGHINQLKQPPDLAYAIKSIPSKLAELIISAPVAHVP